jgi:peptidoglycan-associated lipoprotein
MMKKVLLVLVGLMVFASCSKKETTEDSKTSTAIGYGIGGSDAGQAGALRTVNFDYDQSSLTATAKDTLKKNADWLKNNTKISIQVEGHCDSRGTIEYNVALGERRAIAVKNYLTNLGVKASRINTISYGKERPLVYAENESAWAKNRRANFVVVSK